MKRQGYEVHIDYVPWARALGLVLEGGAEGLLGAYYNEERAKALLYSDPIAESELVVFAMKDSGIVFKKLEDLSPYSIGIIRGAKYPPKFERATSLQKFEANNFEINIKNLLAGRIDLFVEKKGVVLEYMKAFMPDKADRIVSLGQPLATEKYFVCFSKKTHEGQQRINDLNTGLALLKMDGTYRKILKRGLHE
jgi:polar amino acid transport system substrate-binding protein